MYFQPKPTKRFWVAKPIYNQISIGFEPKADYWTVAGEPENYFVIGFPQTKTILTTLRLTEETATKLADAFENERVSAILERRPAFYYRILRLAMVRKNEILSDFHKPF